MPTIFNMYVMVLLLHSSLENAATTSVPSVQLALSLSLSLRSMMNGRVCVVCVCVRYTLLLPSAAAHGWNISGL